MKKKLPNKENFSGSHVDISDDDILQAMKKMKGYVDITTGDFKEVYRFAYQHAIDRLMNFTKAKEIMTKNVISVKKDTPLLQIVEIMADHEISGVPVVDEEDKVIGVISEKDFLSRMGVKSSMGVIVQLLQKRGDIPQPMLWQKAENIMNSPALTVHEDTPISEITNIFTEKNINRVPVVNSEGRIAGIISRADALRFIPHTSS
ncbi:MAG: CBS domain-containing protein [Nitrospirota bacterium]